MRTRRRPALQDKTPGNTPQSHHSNASKAKEALFSEPRKPLGALPIAPEVVPVVSDENGNLRSVPPSPHPPHVRRVPQPPPEPLEETGSEVSAPPTPTPARIRRPGARPSDMPRYSYDMRSDAVRHSDILSAAMLPVRAGSEREPLAYGASSDSSAGPSPSPVKTATRTLTNRRPIAPPTFRPLADSAPSPLPTKHVRLSSSSRPSGGFVLPPPPVFGFEHRTPSFVPPTPKPRHVKTLLRPANEDDGVLASPTPIKSGLGPLPAQSTPAPLRKRRPRLPLNKMPARAPEPQMPVAGSSKAKGKQRAREESLPPSSPPPPSPLGSRGPIPFAVREDLMAELEGDEPLEPEDKENMGMGMGAEIGMGVATDSSVGAVPLQKQRSRSSEDDLFGFIAAERKLKALRRDMSKDKGKAPAPRRAPLGTLVVSRRTPSPSPEPTPGPSTVPLQLPTPDGGSEADSNPGDYRFLALDSPRLERDTPAPELPDPGPGESDPVVQPAYDNGSDVLSYVDPDEVYEHEPALPDPGAQSESASAPGSPEVDPTRTPRKPKSTRKRSPLPTPHFEGESSESEVGEDTPSRSMGPAELLDLTSSVPATFRLRRGVVAEDKMVEVEDEDKEQGEEEAQGSEREEPAPKLKKPATRKRGRGQKEGDDDPAKTAKNLERLLPRRPPKRAKPASDDESESSEPPAKRARGRGRGRGRGRARGAAGRGRGRGGAKAHAEDVPSEEESGSESDVEEEEVKARSSTSRGGIARGRGASRGRGRARGRGISTSSRPPSSSTRVTRSRSQKPASKPDSKGKKRARDEDEEIDIEEDEERARSRQARIEYFRKLEEYSLEKEDVYVI
ncbi:uncharacterized protein B0H18DRAFT_1041525 [Fomitopsis serialis]|uniref:uncharacterized protein n=1 Tax=Fomitopsis serialis TaxID=139415 RepID=UPI0020089478|nr:uncharacterized protein B0H18DRAFT_1041525 [Neoantrodia serialis]KAH9915497.1 hypothetical protein B0H18DRAFT_1041525 [Neoantrodia serialis]